MHTRTHVCVRVSVCLRARIYMRRRVGQFTTATSATSGSCSSSMTRASNGHNHPCWTCNHSRQAGKQLSVCGLLSHLAGERVPHVADDALCLVDAEPQHRLVLGGRLPSRLQSQGAAEPPVVAAHLLDRATCTGNKRTGGQHRWRWRWHHVCECPSGATRRSLDRTSRHSCKAHTCLDYAAFDALGTKG